MIDFLATTALPIAALLGYGAGAVLAVLDLSRQGAVSRSAVPAAAGLGLIANIAVLVLHAVSMNRLPLSTAYESLTALAACVAFVYLYIALTRGLKASQAVFLPVLVLILLIAQALHWLGAGGREVGPSAIQTTHVISIILSVTAYTAAFVGGTLYLTHSFLLQRKRVNLFGKLPALESLENFNYRAAVVGFPLLTIAVLTGFAAYRGSELSGAEVLFNVKVVMALAVWGIYGAVMAFVPRFRARLVAQVNVASFFVLLAVVLAAGLGAQH